MSTIEEKENGRKTHEAGGEGGGTHVPLINQCINGNNNGANSSIRRYLVLLQDCLAIKFVSISQGQQKRIRQQLQQENHHFPHCLSTSSSSCHPHCSCSFDVNLGSGCQKEATFPTKGTCGYYSHTKELKYDLKSNHHDNQDKPASYDDSNHKEDHQELQYYNHQHQTNHTIYPHQSAMSSRSYSNSLGKSNNTFNRDGSSPSGYNANHKILSMINNKSNNLTSIDANKKDYEDVIGSGSQYCRNSSRCSNRELESDQVKNQQIFNRKYYGPTHPYNSLPPLSPSSSSPQSNEQEKGTPKTMLTMDETAAYSTRNNICRAPTKPCLQDSTTARHNSSHLSMMTKVDHSMQALFLYKEFQEINLNCFWNSAVHEAFNHLEYKGSVVPSTIIVGSPIRKYLTILKTAWSRKMLKSPSGYMIDFIGEIEELIADPIAKSHFVPLSDSLCWAIHELTSSGQEAFVDDIFLNLASAFPGMALPTKELIYQTLEKLTRERKIYQTAQGYFVVTPDTHRYITSTEPLFMQSSRADSQLSAATAADFIRNAILLQQVDSQNHTPSLTLINGTESNEQSKEDDFDSPKESPNAPSPDPDTYSLPYGTFKRYNSLRLKKSSSSGTSTGCLPRRTLSMRLPKSKSKNGSKQVAVKGDGDQMGKSRPDVTGSFQNLDASQPSATLNEQLLSRRRKHKSFLSRLLSFRSVKKSGSRKERTGRSSANKARNDKPSKVLISNNDNGDESRSSQDESIAAGGRAAKKEERVDHSTSNHATISTQTSFSIENLNTDLALLALAPPSKSSTLEREDSDSGRCTDSHSDADAEITAALNRGLTPDHHHQHRHHLIHHDDGRRRNIMSSCNVYEKIESDLGLKVDVDECDGRSPRSPSSQMSVSPSPSTFTTASAATCSRANCMNRQNHNNIYSRCHSSASSSGYSYRDFYNLYRRRYPSYYQQSTPTSLESTELNEGVKFKPHQPIRYPPRSFERKQIFDEISRGSFKEKKHRNNNKTVSISSTIGTSECSGTERNNEKVAGQHNSSESVNSTNKNIQATPFATKKASSATTGTTTIVTQTLKNTTNLELEFRLPLGSIISAAMGGRENSTSAINASAQSCPSTNDKLSSERPSLNESSHKTNNGRDKEAPTCTTFSEVNTMVNDLFTIKSFVKSNPLNDELSSMIEFKTKGSNGNISSSSSSNNNNNNALKTCNNGKHNHREQQPQQRYTIEAVSSKPFADIHTKFNRESEII